MYSNSFLRYRGEIADKTVYISHNTLKCKGIFKTGIEDVLIISVHGVIIFLQQRGDQPG
jgi:hypothetical protein